MATDDLARDEPRMPLRAEPEGDTTTTETAPDDRSPELTSFRVDGLADAVEAAEIDDRLTDQAGVIGVNVNAIDQHIDVAYDPEHISPPLLRQKLEETGLDASER